MGTLGPVENGRGRKGEWGGGRKNGRGGKKGT